MAIQNHSAFNVLQNHSVINVLQNHSAINVIVFIDIHQHLIGSISFRKSLKLKFLCSFIAARSCLDFYRHGKHQNAINDVFDESNQLFEVFCDFETDPNRVWTLITSFSLSNKDQYKVAFSIDYPRNENKPNWVDYR